MSRTNRRDTFMRSSVKWSLKTKIALATLVIFLGSLWSLSFYASRMLKRDMEVLMGEQQLTAATVVATQINNELRARVTGLEMTARAIDEAMLRNPVALRRFLEQRIVLYSLFNSVVFIVGTDGTAIASMPLWRNIGSLNYIDRDYIATTLAEGRSTIGGPVLGKELKTPLVGIATPIFNATGQVIGVLAGVTDLSYPNFLQKITENPHGQSGGYFLVSPQDRRVVTGPDISDLMHVLPDAGACTLLDRFVSGYQGSAVLACPGHPEKLASAKRVPMADWFVMATLPTTEAFQPIRNMQHGMLLATLVLTALAAFSLWWMLRRQLAPLTVTAQASRRLGPKRRAGHHECGIRNAEDCIVC